VAASGEWDGFSDACAAIDAVGRHRLAAAGAHLGTDLSVLPAEALRALILTQHQDRMQFGRKSEKLAQQIEQMELRLEELQSNAGQKEFQPPEPASVPASWGATAAAKPTRRTGSATADRGLI